MNKDKKKGFTLIELLVVIAVIGILAAILVPAVTSVLRDAAWTKMKSNGKNLFTVVMADALGDKIVGFPKTGDGYTSTSDYWKSLTGNGSGNTRPKSNKIPVLKATPDFVLAPGMDTPATSWSNITDTQNGWKVGLDQGTTTPAGTAFMVSRNWIGTNIRASDTSDLAIGDAGTDTLMNMLDTTEIKMCVTHFGGSAKVLRVDVQRFNEVNGGAQVTVLNP